MGAKWSLLQTRNLGGPEGPLYYWPEVLNYFAELFCLENIGSPMGKKGTHVSNKIPTTSSNQRTISIQGGWIHDKMCHGVDGSEEDPQIHLPALNL